MLSAKKVRLHGMRDARWTTKDKLTQYKAIISQYKRDQKLMRADMNIQRKMNKSVIEVLKRKNDQRRVELVDATCGDRQVVRNILASDPPILMAYNLLPPTNIVDSLEHKNFTKRKMLDLIIHKQTLKKIELTSMKLHAAVLEDRLKNKPFDKLPSEIQGAAITAKVQDMYLKKEAALVVKYAYVKMLNLLSRDNIYIIKVIDALVDDVRNQGDAMYNTVMLGQIATESLSDKRLDFEDLEAMVKKQMRSRESDMSSVRHAVNSMKERIKKVLRRDSDITMNINYQEILKQGSRVEMLLEAELELVESDLKRLKECMHVSNIEDIFSCLKDQVSQSETLKKVNDELSLFKMDLYRKMKHAHQMFKHLKFGRGKAEYVFQMERDQLQDLISENATKYKQLHRDIDFKSAVVSSIRKSLQHLEILTTLVVDPKEIIPKKVSVTPKKSITVHEEPLEILAALTDKLTTLMSEYKQDIPEDDDYSATLKYRRLINRSYYSLNLEDTTMEESLIAGLAFEDPNVPTAKQLKMISAEIVQQCSKKDF